MMSGYLIGLALAIGQITPTPGPYSPTATPAPAPVQATPAAPIVTQPSAPASPVPIYFPENGAKKENGDKTNGADEKNGDDKKEEEKKDDEKKPRKELEGGFFHRLMTSYYNRFTGNEPPDGPEAERRALPEPWKSPPFPMHEFQGYPLPGVPPESTVYPFMEAVYSGPCGDAIKDSRIKFYGWVNASGNFSQNKNSNAPTSYWLVPNRFELDQTVFRLEREVDSVQTDHMDIGFRTTIFYGMDYRYTTAGGWQPASDELFKHNHLTGWDPIEEYVDWYIPWVAQGLIIRGGRWVACPDIETQLAPDNYLGSHSILFTYDTYTQTGFMATLKLNDNWIVQGGLNAGNDMAPWYKGAIPCGYAAVRWVADGNKDAMYVVLNQINTGTFRHFTVDDQPAGHDNFNYVVGTYEHVFTKDCHTKTEAYYMWQRNAELAGSPSIGTPQSFGGGGGDGVLLPGMSHAYGVLNYTMYAFSKNDFFTVRNEWWRDDRGMRSGFAGNYSSHTFGITHNINSVLQVRPEIGYYRNWDNPAFDLGTKHGMIMGGFDVTLRF